MANKNKILVPSAREELDKLKDRVMKEQVYKVKSNNPNDVKTKLQMN